ncbi:hypothetical protein L3X38_023169 [Prunus dulcis]|uniref:Bulb-type lectin domain-containing protein n=1 Tax=Prunus dulcis TaxID=3755 RepID=A0AAD4Z5A3_PRUDU|nr:hypothetical protein L3X38_023169 [Prunus dulcis]
MSSTSFTMSFIIPPFLFSLFAFISQAQVPANQTFKYDVYRVWDANRGNPVGENATLAFGTDGNLLLADADGRVAWQTDTANKDAVGLSCFQMVTQSIAQRAILFGKALITQQTTYWWAKL